MYRYCLLPMILLISFSSIFMDVLQAAEVDEPKLPEWVQNLPFEEGSLHGVGQAPTHLGPAAAHYARSLAYGAIASQINVSIDQESNISTASMTMIASGINEQGELTNDDFTKTTDDFLQKMTTKTAVPFLPGAKIVEQATVGDYVYVLVRMPKTNFEKAARAKIEQLDRLISESIDAMPADQAGIRIMRRGYQASIERQSLVLVASGFDIQLPPPPVEPETIAARSGLLIEPLSFRLNGAERFPALAEAVRDAADELGISIAEDGAPARFEFKLKGRERVREQAGWQRAAVSATIVVTHLPTRLSLGQIKHEEDQASTISREDALSRAYDRLNDPIYDEIVERLFSLIARSDVK